MKFTNNGIGIQDFETIRTNNTFYIDKTGFIKEWWESGSEVTLITRPRRFGKTLNMSMLECFFSNRYEGRNDLFEGLSISEDEGMMTLQGAFPVIALSFANVKSASFRELKCDMLDLIYDAYNHHNEVEMESFIVNMKEKMDAGEDVDINVGSLSRLLLVLSQKLHANYGKKVIILLDEYDTPMHEAYVNGYWEEAVSLMRVIFNATFKTNRSMYRAVMTGITRIGRESMFSDFNNAEIISITSGKYATSFGFTEAEVFEAMDDLGLSENKAEVKKWYDGFRIGKEDDIYNPWSIINYFDTREFAPYWTNTSSNSLAEEIIRQGSPKIKKTMEDLLQGVPFVAKIDEQMIFEDLNKSVNAIWSLLLCSGYLKIVEKINSETGEYALAFTNYEVKLMFERMISRWFDEETGGYSDFINALLKGDKKAMNSYMNKIALATFSSFDVGNKPSNQCEPERFYHGFVLGLLVDLKGDYLIHSNRESGFGRYDVMLEPLKDNLPAIVMEFKVVDSDEEKSLADTVRAALNQIEEKAYDNELIEKGIARERIFHYGFAFEGKKVLIG